MRGHRGCPSHAAATVGVALLLLLALALAACGTDNGSGNASGGAAATPGASATMVAMHGKGKVAEVDTSTVFHLNAGDTIRVSYKFRPRSSGGLLISIIFLYKYNPSDTTMAKVETLKLAGKRKGATTRTITNSGSYLFAVGTNAASYRVTVVKL